MMKLKVIFALYALYLYYIQSNRMWNNMEINWHLVTLSEIQYINLLEVMNNDFMSIYIKN